MLRNSVSIALTLLALATTGKAQSLAGTVVDALGAPVAGAVVSLSGTAFSATTNATGQFSILGLLNRSYTLQIEAIAQPLAPIELSRTVLGATNVGSIVLQPGSIVTATFTDPLGLPLAQCNCNAYLPDGTKLYTPHDVTNAAGFVTITVPQVAVTLEALPPAGAVLYPWRLDTTPTGPIALGTIAFQQGYTITGTVARAGATPLPIANCEIVVTDQLTETPMVLANKRTNSLGAFSAVLPFGLYRFEFVPAVGNAYAARQLFGVPVAGATTSRADRSAVRHHASFASPSLSLPAGRTPLPVRFWIESPRSSRARSAHCDRRSTISGCFAATSFVSPMSFARS